MLWILMWILRWLSWPWPARNQKRERSPPEKSRRPAEPVAAIATSTAGGWTLYRDGHH